MKHTALSAEELIAKHRGPARVDHHTMRHEADEFFGDEDRVEGGPREGHDA
ncbi:hypothetical protein MTP10_36370 [Nonomuraea sp. 3-1Str]|uniref:hypothetical protein n=1 Tax=unclassified Nonomuraea TaxID=2593643 RepID=UPI0028636FAD|nr:hypothetical protein [Nonomuraea sp. 3-1Str]MDR8414195.1 hypothetical protein [Nonomuraea sp. 3-1Str]